MNILKNNRRNPGLSSFSIGSLNTSGYGDISKTAKRAAIERDAAKRFTEQYGADASSEYAVSKQLEDVDYENIQADKESKNKKTADSTVVDNNAANYVEDRDIIKQKEEEQRKIEESETPLEKATRIASKDAPTAPKAESASLIDGGYKPTDNNFFETVADVWRQANLQGHSVNLGKKQDELLNTEGTWNPQIKTAEEYLQNKKEIQNLLKVNTNNPLEQAQIDQQIDSLLKANSEIEPIIRKEARTNPYLQDIFYETNPGKVFSNEAFGVLDVIKMYTRDLADKELFDDWAPGNNLKHMLEKDITLIPGFETHVLSQDQLNAMWNLKNNSGSKYGVDDQLFKLKQHSEAADLRYKNKTDDILDKINTVKNGNSLFDPTKIDPNFVENFENNEISATDPKSWVYALPHLGSSYSEIGAMVGQMSTSAMLYHASKGALATTSGGTLPLLFAMTEAGANLAIAQYMRESETKSEAFDSYNARVTEDTKRGTIDLAEIQDQIAPSLSKLGYNIDEMKDHEIFSAMLAQNIRTDNQEFNDILDQSKKGLDVVRQTNEALSFGDYAQSLLFSYGGKYLSKMYGLNRLKKSNIGMSNKEMAASNLDRALEADPVAMSNLPLLKQANELIDRTASRVIGKSTDNPITQQAVKKATSAIGDLGKAMGVSYFTERTEEGQQYLVGKNYREGMYDNVQNYGLLDGLANALDLGVQANKAYYGLHENSGLNTDKELINSMKIGGFTGLFMSGVYASKDLANTASQVKTDVKLRGLVADNYAEAETDFKIDQFLNVGKKTGNFTNVYNTLQELKKNKPEGVTDEMIDEDIALARKVYQYSGSKQTNKNIKELGIEKDSEEYNRFIQNAVHIDNRYQSQSESAEASNVKQEKIISDIKRDFMEGSDNKIMSDWLSEQYKSYSEGKKEDEVVTKERYFEEVFNQIIGSIQKRAIEKVSAELEARQDDLQKLAKDQKIDINLEGISGIRKYVEDLRKRSSVQVKDLLDNARKVGMTGTDIELLQQISENTPVIELEEQLQSSIAESILNSGALVDLMEHRNAYLTGKYKGDNRIYAPTWDNLTNTQRYAIIEGKAREAITNGLPEPTFDSIKKEYNKTVAQSIKEQEQMADQNAVQKSRAKALFLQDLRRRYQFEEVAKAEKEEQFGNTQQEPTQEQLNQINEDIKEQEEVEKQLAEEAGEEPTKETITEETTQDVEKPAEQEEIPTDELKEQKEDTPTVEDSIEQDIPESTVEERITGMLGDALEELDRQLSPEIDKIEQEILDQDEVNEFEDATEGDIQNRAEIDLDNRNLDLEERTSIENAVNEIVEANTEKESLDAVEEINSRIEDGNKIEEQLSEDEVPDQEQEDSLTERNVIEDSVEEQKEEERSEIKKEDTVDVPEIPVNNPITVPTVDGDQQSETPLNMLEPDNGDLFIDPATDQLMWDPSGMQDVDNSVIIPDESLIEQATFEDKYADSPFISPADSQNEEDYIEDTPGLSDSNKQKKRNIRNTFFYQPNTDEVMPLTVAGQPLEILTKDGKKADRRPGKELAEKLSIPGWFSTVDDVYYVVTSTTRVSTNPIDDLAVHMLIEKDGKVYNTSLRAVSRNLMDDLKFLGLSKEDIDSEIDALRKLRARIIDVYSQDYKKTGYLPTTALKHVKTVNAKISNGTLNNQKRQVTAESRVPVYRSLTEVVDFGIPSDPNELSQSLKSGEVEIGYGTGPFAMYSEPFEIMGVMQREPTEIQGKGYAGKLYYIPKVENTPSQRVTLPIMLAEELHTIDAETADQVVLAFDEKGKPIYDKDGKMFPLSTAELIYEMLRNPAFFGEATQDLLNLLCNNGSRTVTLGLDKRDQRKYHFLVKKQLHVYPNNKGERILITAGRKLEGDEKKGYTTRFTNLNTATASKKRQIVLDISRNIHWNTDKDVMSTPIAESIVNIVLTQARKNPETDTNFKFNFGNESLGFSLHDIGYEKVDGNIRKVKQDAETPLTLSWMINSQKIKTDLGDHAFKAPFVYADDVAVQAVERPESKVEQKVITTTKEVIAEKKPVVESSENKKGPKMAEPATPENLEKYGLSIPTDQVLLKGRVWGIANIRGQYKVVQAPTQYVKGIFSVVKGQGTVDFQQAKSWLTETLGIDPNNVIAVTGAMRMNSDMEVFGVTNVAVDAVHNTFNPRITLSTVAGKGIEFHEGFHYVSLLLLSDSQRNELYQDYINRNKKAKDFTKEEVEEALAEEFRSWMLKETNPTLGYRAVKFFKQLLHFVSRVRGKGLNYTVFKAIRDGQFKQATVSQETLKEFKRAYERGVFYYIPGMTAEDQAKVPNITDSNTFYKVVDSLTSSALAVYGIKSYEDVKKLNVDSIFDQIQDNFDMGWIDEANEGIVSDVLANQDIFRSKIVDRLGEFSIKEVEKLETEEANKLNIEIGDQPDNVWDKNQGDISKKANVSFSAKLFFYSIPKMEYQFMEDEAGNVTKVAVEVKDPIFGLPVTEPFDVVWTRVMEELWDVDTYEDIVDRSRVLGNTVPFFKTLYEQLVSVENPLSSNTQTQLLTTIKSSKNSMTTLKISSDRPQITFGMSDEHVADEMEAALKRPIWSVEDSDNLRKIARYPQQWSRAFFTSDNVEVMEDGSRQISELGYKFMNSKRMAISSLVKQAKLKKNNKNNDFAATEQILKDRFVELCNGLMIPFDQASLDYMLDQFKDTNIIPGQPKLNQFVSMWEAYGKSFKSVLGDLTKMYASKSMSASVRSGSKVRSLDRIFTSNDSNSQINLMAVAYGKTHPTPEEFSVTGADNSLIYPISENNYMSDQVRWMNQGLHNKKENILNTPYSKRSLLANNKGNIKLHTLIALNDTKSGTSRDYFGISPLEDYIAKLVLTFQNHLTLPTMSDKKTWYSISGIKLERNLLNTLTSEVGMQDGMVVGSVTAEQGERFNDKNLNIMSNYFFDELDAIIDYYEHKDYVATHPEEYVKNYHGKINNGKMGADGNGGRFRYFNKLTFNGEVVSLNKQLSLLENNGSTQEVLNFLRDTKELATANNNLVLKDAMNTLLSEKTTQEIQKLKDLGIVDIRNGMVVNKFIPHNIMRQYREDFSQFPYSAIEKSRMENDIIRSIIGSHVFNTIVSIQEVEKCFTGDPAYYKWQRVDSVQEVSEENGEKTSLDYKTIVARDVDKIKRLSSVLSTGTNLRTYWGPGQEKKNNTKFTVMNLADNNVTSSYHGMLYDAFRNSLIRDMVSVNNPELVDSELIELTNSKDKQENQYKQLSDEQKKFVDEQSVNSAKPYGKERINQADAAVYIRPDMYRRVVEALGEWSPEVEAAFDLLEQDIPEGQESWLTDSTKYLDAMNSIIKPLKMMYFGDHRNDKLNLNIPVFDKMAIFPMFKVMAQADNKVIYDRMNNAELGEIDMIAFESAVKVGGRQDIKLYKDEFNNEFDADVLNKPSYDKFGQVGNLPTYVQDLSQLRLQLNTDSHEATERSFGTQAVKICLGNTIDDRIYGENKGRSVDGATIKEGVMDAIKALSRKGKTSIMRRFFKDGKVDNAKLSEFLISQAKSSGLSDEFIFGLSLNELGEFRMPLAAMSTRGWVESRIISLVNKECIDVNTPGGSAIQVSSFGFKATGIRKESSVGKAFNDGKKLEFINPDGSMDVMLSVNFFRHVVPLEHQGSHASMRKWLLENNVIGKDSKPFGVGYRIPTQGLSSTFAFKVMDVMPAAMGDVIVVPDEFTGQTGSDFDVDKVYIATNAYEDGKYVEWAMNEDGTEVPADKQSKKALTNRMLDYYTLVISDHKNMAETRASIDTLTALLQKEILPLVQPKQLVEADSMYELMPSLQLARKEEYTSGKAGIAPFALNSTNHCLTQLVHLNMEYSHGNIYNLGQMDGIDGQDGFRILDWLSAMVNAHVDVAKDPYIISLNVNQITYNITNLLLRGGKGKTTFYFLAQPILKKFTEKKIANNGIYGVSENVFDNQLIGELIKEYEGRLRNAILALDKTSDEYDVMVSLFNGWLKDKNSEGKNPTMPIPYNKDAQLPNKPDALDEKKLITSLKEAQLQTPRHLYQQLQVMKAYMELDSDASVMSELVHRSQIDTKKFGNNLGQQMNFKNSYNTFIEDNANRFTIKGVAFDQNNPKFALQKYFGDTFLSQKLYLGTSLPRKILKSQTFTATQLYESIFTSVMATFGKETEVTDRSGEARVAYKHVGDKKLVNNLNKIIESIVRARVTNKLPKFQVSDQHLNDMFFGRNTMCKRLSGIKQFLIENKNDFPHLVGQDGVIKNDLLNYLQEYSGDGVKQKVDRIILFNSSMNNSISTENRLISAFSDLLESDNDIIKDFANDLALYAYFTSYDNGGVNSFFHLVPIWWKDLNGYISSIKDSLYAFSYDTDHGASQVLESGDSVGQYGSISITMARNLWRDDSIVKPHKLDTSKGDKTVYNAKKTTGGASTIVPTLFTTRQDADFIKMQTGRDYNNTNLYRKVGTVYYEHNESGKKLATKSVYQIIPKLGFNDNGYQIYELDKESVQKSAFDENNFTQDMIIDASLIGDDVIKKSLPKLKKDAEDYTAVFSQIEQTKVDVNISDEANPLSDNIIDESAMELQNVADIAQGVSESYTELENNAESFETAPTENVMEFGADQIGTELFSTDAELFEQEFASEMWTLGNTMEEVESFGDNFITDYSQDTTIESEQNTEMMQDTESLSLLGQQRKKECE